MDGYIEVRNGVHIGGAGAGSIVSHYVVTGDGIVADHLTLAEAYAWVDANYPQDETNLAGDILSLLDSLEAIKRRGLSMHEALATFGLIRERCAVVSASVSR